MAKMRLLPFLLALAAAGQDLPNTIPLSKLMEELSQKPEVRDEFFRRLDLNPADGILGQEHIRRLRQLVLGKDWRKVDHFPGFSVEALGRTVKLAVVVMGKPASGTLPPPPAGTRKLGLPAAEPAINPADLSKDLGFGLVWGEDPHPELGKWHANSTRLAEALNKLSLGQGKFTIVTASGKAATPEGLIELLGKSGHTYEVRDARYFANFGDLRYRGQDVFTGFWLDTELEVPGANRTLLVPVGHSQHELWVKGPINAVVSIYFGIDGKAEFRAVDTKDQGWVMGNVAHKYEGSQALEVIRSAGAIVRAYRTVHEKNPGLPWGGYYRLGVCNDVNAMIEHHMRGKTTLFPLTVESKYFEGLGEVEQWAKALPTDGGGRRPEFDRIRGSIPVARIEDLPFPELRDDLLKVRQARDKGERTSRRSGAWIWVFVLIAALAAAGWWMRRRSRASV